jgi:hypothetical protein
VFKIDLGEKCIHIGRGIECSDDRFYSQVTLDPPNQMRPLILEKLLLTIDISFQRRVEA